MSIPCTLNGDGHVHRWIVIIGGFLQSRYSTGLSRIWIELMDRHPERSVRITSHPWNDDWRGLASWMDHQLRSYGSPAPIQIISYSWGTHGAMVLSRHLKSLGYNVDVVVSCDGVARPWLARWRALWSPVLSWLIGEPRIPVPANVQRVVYVRQKTNLPRGHLFKTENGTELVDSGMLPKGITHQDADNHPVFRKLVMEVVG